MNTPREPEPRQAKNGSAKIAVAKTGKSFVATTAKSQSTDDAVKWWRAFKRFKTDADELQEYYDDLCEQRWGRAKYPKTAASLKEDAEWCQELVAKCRAGFERFDSNSNYEDDEDGESVLKTVHIASRLGVMIGSWMNALPQSPELFARAMVEQVADIDGLAAVALETACREIVRTEKWPDIPKIVDMVEKHVGEWCKRREALGVELLRLELIPVLVERERKQAREAEEKRLSEERAREQREKWERERPEREAREREERERQERERQEREAREAEERCQKFVNAQLEKLAKEAEVESVWYWFQLLLMSRGIFVSIEVLARLRREKSKERIRKWKELRGIRYFLEGDDEALAESEPRRLQRSARASRSGGTDGLR